MKFYKLMIFSADGQPISYRNLRVTEDDFGAMSYHTGRMAEELLRDALYRDGLWEKYRGSPFRKNYWTQE